MNPLSPSGRQVTIAHGLREVVVVEVGGGLRSYTIDGEPVLDGYGEDEMCSGGRGQVLAPWPNRVADGRYEWGGRRLQIPLNEPEHRNAIHGLVRWGSWAVADCQPDSARLEYRLHPQPGWPWTLDLAVTYTVGDGGLRVRTEARNQTEDPCPFGLGFHPYLVVPATVDGVTLRVPASTAYRSDARGLPTGIFRVDSTDLDFRGGRAIGQARLDRCYTDLERDARGRSTVTARFDGRERKLWFGPAFTHVMVYTGDTLPEVERRRRGLAVEPMTCPPDMLRTGTGRIVLGPDEAFEAEWGIE